MGYTQSCLGPASQDGTSYAICWLSLQWPVPCLCVMLIRPDGATTGHNWPRLAQSFLPVDRGRALSLMSASGSAQTPQFISL